MGIVRSDKDTVRPKTTSIERSKIVLAVALEFAAKEMLSRLMDNTRRGQIKDKDLGDFVDKTAKYVLPRDIRIRISDPEVLQAIAQVTAEMLPEGEFQTWLTRVGIALEGKAISKNMVSTGVSPEDVMEDNIG